MSTLLYALGRRAYRGRLVVVGVWVLLLAGLAAGAATLGTGTSEEFRIPGTASQEALDTLGDRFPELAGGQAQVVAVASDVTDPTFQKAVQASLLAISKVDGVTAVVDPYNEQVQGAISADRQVALGTVQVEADWRSDSDTLREAIEKAAQPIEDAGGQVEFGGEVFAVSLPSVTPTEGIGVVVALVVLIVTFGSFLAAGLPLLTALLGVGATMAAIWLFTPVLDISSTVPLLALMIGLAVGIDYALLIVSRHRDQLREGLDPEESAARAVAKAGSAVVFAGITVIIALIGLAVARIPFLTVMGVAAAGAVLVAVLVALTLLPALFGFLGARLAPKAGGAQERHRFANSWLSTVIRVPVVTVLLVVVAVGALAIPAKDLRLALTDNGAAASDTTQRQAFDLVADHFGAGANAPLLVTADLPEGTDPQAVLAGLAQDLSGLEGVAGVSSAAVNSTGDLAVVALVPQGSASSVVTSDLVKEVRDDTAIAQKYGVTLGVTGQTAIAIDISDRLRDALLPFGIAVVGLSLILLGAVFRSVAVPVKAALGYLLSVGASFGAVTAVFEWGWLSGLLGVQREGPVISFMPIILMGVLFGLAMDYEVFLVARIREEFVHNGGDARKALRTGYASGSRVVTAAALIMVSVFTAFVPEGDANIKPIALALAVGVFVDAFVVRMIFVPAVLALLGNSAWWIPRWLDRLLPHFDVEGEGLEKKLQQEKAPSPV
ncbi:MMPL family transporter [Kineosporia succinea]|uniref:RND superfamily putative drug exporter n=1 Tax=Kineosporia succinea TaxID=84632 RepID=A0ABT9NZJ8_9ACTN|nr:MMPL family transporter [Kineosporia succinea]MDP9825852.1 RND superfamily putative drug exporter [Kineosporia succinea]